MSYAGRNIPIPPGYQRLDRMGYTFYIKTAVKKPELDMVYVEGFETDIGLTKVPPTLMTVAKAGAAPGGQGIMDVYMSIPQDEILGAIGGGDTGAETTRLLRQEKAAADSAKATSPEPSPAMDKQLDESTLAPYDDVAINDSNQEALNEALKSESLREETPTIDPLTGQVQNNTVANDPGVLTSPDSTDLKSFLENRKKYLIGNTDIDPSILFELTSVSSIDRALGQTMRGMNLLRAPTSVPLNKDSKGYIFFTRPQLNLQDSNIGNHRKFYPLLTDMDLSMQRQIRGLLDPRLQRTLPVLDIPGESARSGNVDLMKKVGYAIKPLNCPFVDPLNPFIPVLTNTCEAMSGFPDLALNTFSSKPGMHKESYVQYDDIAKTSETIDIECTFKGIMGDPITWLFYIWVLYGALVFEGTLLPYLDYIGERWMDSQTRIWRLVMDKSNTYVTKIAATGPAIPISLPLGSFFDFDVDSPYADQNKSISVRFRCMGAEWLDDILVDEFNRTTYMFNPEMRDEVRARTYTKVDKVHASIMNHLAYPHINLNTYELEWYVNTGVYNRVITNMKAAGVYGGNYA